MKITALFLLIFCSNVFAENDQSYKYVASKNEVRNLPFCAIYNAFALKDEINIYRKKDKFKHCALSCQLTLRCGPHETLNIGILKELWDLISPGNAEIDDIRADLAGIKLVINRKALNDMECADSCGQLYE